MTWIILAIIVGTVSILASGIAVLNLKKDREDQLTGDPYKTLDEHDSVEETDSDLYTDPLNEKFNDL